MSIPCLTYPTDATDTGEDLWTRLLSPLMANGVVWMGGAGYGQVYADSTGLTVKVRYGRVFINGFMGEIASAGAVATLTIAAPDAFQPRTDLVVARLDLSGAQAQISLVVVTGTPGADPVSPTPGSQDVALAYVSVAKQPNATIAANQITTIRSWTGSIPWTDWAPVITVPSGSSYGVQAYNITWASYRIVNGTCAFALQANVTLNAPGSTIVSSLPVNARHADWQLEGSGFGVPTDVYTYTPDFVTYYAQMTTSTTGQVFPAAAFYKVRIGGSFQLAP